MAPSVGFSRRLVPAFCFVFFFNNTQPVISDVERYLLKYGDALVSVAWSAEIAQTGISPSPDPLAKFIAPRCEFQQNLLHAWAQIVCRRLPFQIDILFIPPLPFCRSPPLNFLARAMLYTRTRAYFLSLRIHLPLSPRQTLKLPTSSLTKLDGAPQQKAVAF